MDKIDVSIIMINYNNYKLTFDAVKSIIEKSRDFTYEIIIVDNSNDIIEFENLKEVCKGKAICIRSNNNLGFGKANNLGVLNSKGKYVYFLNNDTLLINNAIFELYNFLVNNQNVGIVGSNLFTKDMKPAHSYMKYEMNLKNIKRNDRLLIMFYRRIMRRNDFNYSQHPIELKGYVCGASLMISRENFNKIGGFDKDIFMYAEDVLLCYEVIHKLNLKIFNIPSSKIIHLEGASLQNEVDVLSYNKAKMMLDGKTVYFTKAYNINESVKYFKYLIKVSKKKRIISKLIKLKNPASYTNTIKACNDKLTEICNKENVK